MEAREGHQLEVKLRQIKTINKLNIRQAFKLTKNMLIGNALLCLSVGHYANTGGKDETLLLHNGHRQHITTNGGESSRVDLLIAFVELNGRNLISAILLIVI